MSSTTTPPATSSTAGTTTTIEIVSPLAPPTGEVIATGDGWEMAQLGEPFRFLVPLAVHDYIEASGCMRSLEETIWWGTDPISHLGTSHDPAPCACLNPFRSSPQTVYVFLGERPPCEMVEEDRHSVSDFGA